jgi:hypothetical protein
MITIKLFLFKFFKKDNRKFIPAELNEFKKLVKLFIQVLEYLANYSIKSK